MSQLEGPAVIHSAEEFIALCDSRDEADSHRASWDEANPNVWREVVSHHPEYRKWVAHNRTIDRSIMEVLASDSDPQVRHMLAKKRRLPGDLLDRLASDPDDSVRLEVAYHRKTSLETLHRLANDPWDKIQRVVGERLGVSD